MVKEKKVVKRRLNVDESEDEEPKSIDTKSKKSSLTLPSENDEVAMMIPFTSIPLRTETIERSYTYALQTIMQ